MDVNGYTFLVRKARDSILPDHKKGYEIKDIPLTALQEAFSGHTYWGEIQNDKSDLC